MWSLSKHSHLQPRCHSKARSLSRQLYNGLLTSNSIPYIPRSLSYPDFYYPWFGFSVLYVSRSVRSGHDCARIIACWAGCVQKLSADSEARNSLVQIFWRLVPGPKLFNQSYVCLCVGRWHHGVASNCFPDPPRRVISISLNSVLNEVRDINVVFTNHAILNQIFFLVSFLASNLKST